MNRCPKCSSHNVHVEDESFSHDWNGGGIEIIRYPVCDDCGYEDEDWTEDDLREELEE